MKKFLLVLLGAFMLNTAVFAQIGGTTQYGKATHEMDDSGFFAAHVNFPLGSTIKVVNTVNGMEIDATINGRIRLSRERIIDLSPDAWDALELTPDTTVKVMYSPPPVSRANPAAAAPPVTETAWAPSEAIRQEYIEQIIEYPNEMPRLNASQTLYHLLLLERKYCAPYSDISDLDNINIMYKFPHGRNGYLIAVYSSSREGPVFPVMPPRSRILVNIITSDIAFLRDYVNSAAFKRFITDKQVMSQLQKTLQ